MKKVKDAGLAGAVESYLLMVNVTKSKCTLDGFPSEIEGRRHDQWVNLAFCHDTPLDIANFENAPLRAHTFVLAAAHSAIVLLSSSQHGSFTPDVVYDPVRMRLPRLQGWLLWHTAIEPDHRLCAGPVRPSDTRKMKF